MNHRDTLRLLFPAEITGVFEDDTALEGKHLDTAQVSAEGLLEEMMADRAYNLLTDWERVCALIPDPDGTLQARQDAVVRILRSRGGLSRAYFIDIAASFGWQITIDELLPFMCGWNRAGDILYEDSVRWIWRVNVSDYAAYSFRTGLSCAGERLTWWLPIPVLEELFNDLKPANTYVIFNYS
jgi:uncharacterized protein YmfQ (DUF2313 family)